MNVREKITSYRNILGFTYFQELADSAGVQGRWLTELVKKDEITSVDIRHLLKLCNYFGITINQLFEDEEPKEIETIENIDKEDIGYIIKEMIVLLDKENIKMDDMKLNNQAKQVCKDALLVVKQLTRQYL